MTADTVAVPQTGGATLSTVLRVLGWLLIIAGAVVALFIFWLLVWTGRETAAAQAEMLTEWQSELGAFELGEDGDGVADIPVVGPLPDEQMGPLPDIGSSVALLWFERDGERIIIDRYLSVLEGVDLPLLDIGPGHYPDTEGPGQAGNFGVAAHRTTALAPFYNLDLLRAGDEIHVVDRDGNHFVYDFQKLEVVLPHELWVLEDDPLGQGTDHWLTLTTCHPRFSAAERLIAFASLRMDA